MESLNFILSGAAPMAESDILKFYEKFALDPDKVKFCQGKIESLIYITVETDNLYNW